MFTTENETPVILKQDNCEVVSYFSQEESDLLKHAREMKHLLHRLELPWDIYIPILHKAFVLYIERVSGQQMHNLVMQQTCDLMSSITYLCKHGKNIGHLVQYYHEQIIHFETLKKERISQDNLL